MSTPFGVNIFQEKLKMWDLGANVTGTKPGILLFCENRHPTLNFAQTYSFCGRYFQLKRFVEQVSGFTVLIFCVD